MIIAVDTGGTKTLVAGFSKTGQLLQSRRFPTPRNQQMYITQTIDAIKTISSGEAIDGVMVAVAGVVRHQVAVICKNLEWYDFDILSSLRPHFPPNTPLWLENDANIGGVGAAHLLPTVQQRLLYVTLSTGIGGGFIVDGQINAAISDSEMRDIHFEYNGRIVGWESIVNGAAIMRDFGAHADRLHDPVILKEIAQRIARGLLALIPVLRPDVIAIGGRVGAMYYKFSTNVAQELSVLPAQYTCQIVTVPKPEEVVAYGCYFYTQHQLSV